MSDCDRCVWAWKQQQKKKNKKKKFYLYKNQSVFVHFKVWASPTLHRGPVKVFGYWLQGQLEAHYNTGQGL